MTIFIHLLLSNAKTPLITPMPKLIPGRRGRTDAIIWLLAILCTIIAIVIIAMGLFIFTIYMIYQPRIPYLTVIGAYLDKLDYDQSGLLDSTISLAIRAENDNLKAHATFSHLSVKLRFLDAELAELRSDDFDVEKNGSVVLNYVVASASVPLDKMGMDEMDASLRRDLIVFGLDGKARTRWKVGSVTSVKLWTHLQCGLKFFVSNRTANGLHCSSKSHSL